MKILVTGATGFVGRWLVADLVAAGHEVLPSGAAGRVDVTDRAAITAEIRAVRPDAIAHLAGVAYAPDASHNPSQALAVQVGGTLNVVHGLAALGGPRILLISGSSEVYGAPNPADLPLRETAPITPRGVYGMTKVAQEAVGLESGLALGLRVVVTRSFNHTGPGQRTDFAIPAFAARILAARAAGTDSIRVGDIDVRRDISDVRDVVRAYRLLLELAEDRGTSDHGLVVNVASGTSIAMRDAISAMSRQAGYEIRPSVDPDLIRTGEPAEIRGDPTRLRALVGWRPEISLARTLGDVVEHLARTAPE